MMSISYELQNRKNIHLKRALQREKGTQKKPSETEGFLKISYFTWASSTCNTS